MHLHGRYCPIANTTGIIIPKTRPAPPGAPSGPPGGAKTSGNASQQAAHQVPTAPKSGGPQSGACLLQVESELDFVLDGAFVLSWQRTYALNHSGDIVRVHPQSINGQTAAQHPPTGSGLASWKPWIQEKEYQGFNKNCKYVDKKENVMTDERINKHAHAVARKLRELDPDPDAAYTYEVVSTHEGATKEEMEKILAEHVRELRAQGHELPLQDHEFPLDMEPDGEYVMKDEAVRIEIKSLGVPELDDFADMGSIVEKINTHIELVFPRVNIKDLSGWRLILDIGYLRADFISIPKKLGRYPSDRVYLALISIPIPDNTQAPYGVPLNEDKPTKYFKLSKESLYHILDPEYDKYDNLDQYIIASTIKAIDFGFSKGFSKGFTGFWKKIKFKDL